MHESEEINIKCTWCGNPAKVETLDNGFFCRKCGNNSHSDELQRIARGLTLFEEEYHGSLKQGPLMPTSRR